MGNGNDGRVRESQGDGGDGFDTGQESVDQLGVGDIQNVGGEGVSGVEDLNDSHTVCERGDVQHVQERGFGWADPGTSGDDLHVGDNFDGSPGNLGGDTQSLEEGCFSGLHPGVSGRDNDISRGKGTCPSGGSYFVLNNEIPDVLQIARGEDESDVASDMGKEAFKLGVVAKDRAQSTSDHGVLAHDDGTLATKGNANLMHLVGPDIVDVDHEDGSWKEHEFRHRNETRSMDVRNLAISSLRRLKYSSFCARVAPIVDRVFLANTLTRSYGRRQVPRSLSES